MRSSALTTVARGVAIRKLNSGTGPNRLGEETTLKRLASLLLGFGLLGTASAQTVEIVATDLNVPWSMAFAPDGRMFVNERPGRVRVIDSGGLQAAPVIDLSNPDVIPDGQAVRSSTSIEGGLLGLAVDPDFATSGYLYVYYTYGTTFPVNLHNRVARLIESGGAAVYDATILDNIPGGSIHDGGRIKIGPDGKLYATVGASVCAFPQDLNSLAGKILRMNLDGSVPDDNPVAGSLVYSYGNRNPQGIAWDTRSDPPQLYETEHGPTGDCGWSGSYDEVNIIYPVSDVYPTGNYGWPLCIGACGDPRWVDPLRFWQPVSEGGEGTAAPTGAAFYNGSMYFGTMGFPGNTYARHLHKITFDQPGGTIIIEDLALFRGLYGRIRDVVAGPDGYLYFSNSNRDGRGGDVLQPDDDKIFRVSF